MNQRNPQYNLKNLFQGVKADTAARLAKIRKFNASMRKPNLAYERKEEPAGWPLTRPATRYEWSHVLRAMIVRRVPESGPIHKGKLIGYVHADLQAASDAGRIYVTSDFYAMRSVPAELDRLLGKANVLKAAPRMKDPEMPFEDEAIYRTEHTPVWLSRVPKVVQAVVDFLPTTSVLDLMVQALIDAPGSDPHPQPPQS